VTTTSVGWYGLQITRNWYDWKAEAEAEESRLEEGLDVFYVSGLGMAQKKTKRERGHEQIAILWELEEDK
jgi:hypothetical protein